MNYPYQEEATYLFGTIESDIIRVGAEWEKWSIGTTDNPEMYNPEYVYKAKSPDEAKITVDFTLSRRPLVLDSNSIQGTFIYVLKSNT